jgi:hypothetical protein
MEKARGQSIALFVPDMNRDLTGCLGQRLGAFDKPCEEAGANRGGFVVEVIGGVVQACAGAGA